MIDDEEEKNQEQEAQDPDIIGNNFASRAARRAQGLADNAEAVAKGASKMAERASARATVKTGSKAEKLLRKSERLKKAAEKAKKVQEKAQKFAKLAAKIGKFIVKVGWIILLIMIIIGFLVFIITGWGIIMNGLKEIVAGFWDACKEIAGGGEKVVHADEIVDLMDTIEEMGYDLYGYGFVSSVKSEKNDKNEYVNKYYETTDDGNEVKLLRELEDKKAYKYLTTYLISDNYAYYIKNHNFNFKTMNTDLNHFFKGIMDSTSWGSGLISIYKQSGGNDKITGKRGEVYGSLGDKLKDNVIALPACASQMTFGARWTRSSIRRIIKNRT